SLPDVQRDPGRSGRTGLPGELLRASGPRGGWHRRTHHPAGAATVRTVATLAALGQRSHGLFSQDPPADWAWLALAAPAWGPLVPRPPLHTLLRRARHRGRHCP